MTTDFERVHIERNSAAPIDQVWAIWTDPSLFRNWYGPMGCSEPVAEMDVTVGVTRKICMAMVTSERTMTYWLIGTKKVSAPDHLVTRRACVKRTAR
ncbi:MAG: SRPBCC domain-containing protein [Pseudomonadota bacterium]